MFVLADFIAGVFGGSDGKIMVELTARGLRFYSVSIVLYGINNVFVNYTQGMRRMAVSNTFCFLESFVFLVIPALGLSGVFQTDAVWLAYIIAEVAAKITIVIFASVKKHSLPSKASDFLFLKEPFGVDKKDLFEVSITNEDDVIPASKAANKFCEEHNAPSKTAMLLSLFIEELSNNIVQHGFADNKNHSIDIRLICTEDGWTLRFRDNCKQFDSTSWIKLHQSDDPTPNIGIRMVCGMAKKIDYLSTMELNNLTIKI